MQLTDELARLFVNLGRALAKRADQGMDNQDFSTLVTLASGAYPEGTRLSDLAAIDIDPRSSPPRVRTATAPASFSRSPTTRRWCAPGSA